MYIIGYMKLWYRYITLSVSTEELNTILMDSLLLKSFLIDRYWKILWAWWKITVMRVNCWICRWNIFIAKYVIVFRQGKAFDRVPRTNIWKWLQEKNMNKKLIRTVQSLYKKKHEVRNIHHKGRSKARRWVKPTIVHNIYGWNHQESSTDI